MANWVFITNNENWEIIKNKNVMGFSGRWGKYVCSKIKVHDISVIYIKKISVFSGIFEITSKNSKKPNN